MALGADQGDVLRLVLARAMALTAWGLGVGVAGALICTRILSSLLFQVQPGDPLTLAAVSALLALVALVAGLVPARRASRIDPVVALRAE
jgi:putative ABC transport system permease protein